MRMFGALTGRGRKQKKQPGVFGKNIDPDAPMKLIEKRGLKGKVTAHGFRSAFRNWAAEQTNFPREIADASLAHRSAMQPSGHPTGRLHCQAAADQGRLGALLRRVGTQGPLRLLTWRGSNLRRTKSLTARAILPRARSSGSTGFTGTSIRSGRQSLSKPSGNPVVVVGAPDCASSSFRSADLPKAQQTR